MSNAEKFISEHTRNCSNQHKWDVETPNKSIIYVQPWLTPDQARRAVEIAREEVIEKVCSFISNNMYAYIAVKHANTPTFIEIDYDRFENDLKQAMKDE